MQDPYEKIAYLLLSLDDDKAQEILSCMDEKNAAKTLHKFKKLKRVSPHNSNPSVEEKGKFPLLQKKNESIGMEEILYLFKKHYTNYQFKKVFGNLELSNLVKNVDAHTLLQAIKDEHPQTVALVLAHCSDWQAAKVITGIRRKIQSEVLVKLAHMTWTSPGTVAELSDILKARIGMQRSIYPHKKGGVKQVAAVLSQMSDAERNKYLEDLKLNNPTTANKVAENLNPFSDIFLFKNQTLQILLVHIKTECLTKALATESQEAIELILNALSRPRAGMIREELAAQPRIKIKEAIAAQQEILAIVSRLKREGKI